MRSFAIQIGAALKFHTRPQHIQELENKLVVTCESVFLSTVKEAKLTEMLKKIT